MKNNKKRQNALKPIKKDYKSKNKALQSPRKPEKEVSGTLHPFVGRPPKYETVEELEALIDAYFASCWEQKIDMFGNPIFMKDARGKKTKIKVMVQKKPYIITGLAIALGTTRDILIDYEKQVLKNVPKDLAQQFSNTIKRAKEMCKGYAEEQLFIGKNPTGAIFNLKNNYGFKDKTETEHSGNLTWTEEPPK